MKNLIHKIVKNKSVTSGKRSDESIGICVIPHGDGRQLQSNDPSFCARFQTVYLFLSKVQPHGFIEEKLRFVIREAQIFRTQFNHFAAGTVLR